MRKRILALGVVVGLGAVTIALAQQSGPSQQVPAGRDALRAQVAKLRAEVELLQLEHDADVGILKPLTVDMRSIGAMEEGRPHILRELQAFRTKAGAGEDVGSDEGELNKEMDVNKATADAIRPIYERLRKAFLRETAELNQKKLELVELERKLDIAR